MGTWTASDHPRGEDGRFKAQARTEPTSGISGRRGEPALKVFRSEDGQRSYRYGRLHRVDGPAIIRPDGHEAWHLDGDLHRVDGPAIVRADGGQEWWLFGKQRREDGPAVIYPTGFEAWLLHGQNHRTNGPAITWPDGRLEWWENDVRKPPEVEAALSMVWLARTPPGA